MNLSLGLARQYKSAVIFAASQQAITGILSAMLLDGGVVLGIWCFTVLACWMGVVVIAIRRPLTPTRSDILFIEFGFIPLFIFACFVSFSLWC